MSSSGLELEVWFYFKGKGRRLGFEEFRSFCLILLLEGYFISSVFRGILFFVGFFKGCRVSVFMIWDLR